MSPSSSALGEVRPHEHPPSVERAHRERARAQLLGYVIDGVEAGLAGADVDRVARAVGRGDPVVLVASAMTRTAMSSVLTVPKKDSATALSRGCEQ